MRCDALASSYLTPDQDQLRRIMPDSSKTASTTLWISCPISGPATLGLLLSSKQYSCILASYMAKPLQYTPIRFVVAEYILEYCCECFFQCVYRFRRPAVPQAQSGLYPFRCQLWYIHWVPACSSAGGSRLVCHETGSLLLVELLCNASADQPIRWDVIAVCSNNLERSAQGVVFPEPYPLGSQLPCRCTRH